MEINEDFVRRLSELRSTFGEQLGAKVSDLKARWRQWLDAPQQNGTLVDLRRAAHSLVGGGATFGFPAISDRARVLETFLKHVLAANDPPSQEVELTFDLLFEELVAGLNSPPVEPVAWVQSQFEAVSGVAPERKAPADSFIHIVDGDQELAQSVSGQLTHFGYHVRCFSTLRAAGIALQAESPAAVIIEMELPDGNGADFAASHQRGLLKGIPVFFCSKQSDFANRLKAVRSGSRGFFTKPAELAHMVDALDMATHINGEEPLRVLLVDDSPAMVAFHAAVLNVAGMRVHTLTDPLRTLDVLREVNPDLMLCDLYMPPCSGFELARVVRQESAFSTLPIVFLSVEDDYDKQLSGLKEGGDDFLIKPIKPAHLVAAVVGRANRARMLRSLVSKDSLTGLLNHIATKDRLATELSRAVRLDSPLCAVMIDLDHFKRVNDNFGHPTGDRVIKGLSRLLYQRLRNSDVVGRYGGEEFLVILLDTTLEQGFLVIEEMRQNFSQLVHQTTDGTPLQATFSAGITAYPGHSDVADILSAADNALYLAKADGRNRVALME